eukprot:2282648-Rhodomonas_salina.1
MNERSLIVSMADRWLKSRCTAPSTDEPSDCPSEPSTIESSLRSISEPSLLARRKSERWLSCRRLDSCDPSMTTECCSRRAWSMGDEGSAEMTESRRAGNTDPSSLDSRSCWDRGRALPPPRAGDSGSFPPRTREEVPDTRDETESRRQLLDCFSISRSRSALTRSEIMPILDAFVVGWNTSRGIINCPSPSNRPPAFECVDARRPPKGRTYRGTSRWKVESSFRGWSVAYSTWASATLLSPCTINVSSRSESSSSSLSVFVSSG